MNAIAPPNLVPASKSLDAAEKPKRPEFTPSSLDSGATEDFRLLGRHDQGSCLVAWRWPCEQEDLATGELRFSGFSYSKEYPGHPAPNAARATDWSKADRPKLEGEYTKPRSALLWLAWSYERSRVELMIIEQRGLRESLGVILAEEDTFTFSDEGIADFRLRMSRTGKGTETSYSLIALPKPIGEVEAEAFADLQARQVRVSAVLENGHPLIDTGRTSFNSPDGGADEAADAVDPEAAELF